MLCPILEELNLVLCERHLKTSCKVEPLEHQGDHTLYLEDLTQQQAADLMNIDQPKVSKIIRGLLSEFSIERLLKFVLALGFDLEIIPKPHKAKSTPPSMHIISQSSHSLRLRAC